MDLEQFRSTLDDTYSILLASDSVTGARLIAQIIVHDSCLGYGTYFFVKTVTEKLKTQSLSEASRRYWEICNRG